MTTPTLREALTNKLLTLAAILDIASDDFGESMPDGTLQVTFRADQATQISGIFDDFDALPCIDYPTVHKSGVARVRAALAAQPELPEPTGYFRAGATLPGYGGWMICRKTDAQAEPFYTAAQLQQAVEQARASAPQSAFDVIKECEAALAEELGSWDIDPPIHHVKKAHEACVAWLAAAPQPVAQKGRHG